MRWPARILSRMIAAVSPEEHAAQPARDITKAVLIRRLMRLVGDSLSQAEAYRAELGRMTVAELRTELARAEKEAA